MKCYQVLIVTAISCLIATMALGEEATISASCTAPGATDSCATATTVPAATATTVPAAIMVPTTQPKSKVLATVGKLQITEADINGVLERYTGQIPPDRMADARKSLLGQMIQRKQLVAYLKPDPCTDADVAAWKQKNIVDYLKAQKISMSVEQFMAQQKLTEAMVREYVSMDKLMAKFKEKVESTVVQSQIDTLLKASPVWQNDGTSVRASHVLIMCDPDVPDAEKAKAREKLAAIAIEIAAGKITFADAARKYSGCPSSANGGDLNTFTYGKMVKPFSEAAFGMKVGQVSDIVETKFGFHLIKVTDRTEGTGKLGPDARKEAEQKLMAQEQAKILSEAAKAFPAVIVKQAPAASKAAPAVIVKPEPKAAKQPTTQPMSSKAS